MHISVCEVFPTKRSSKIGRRILSSPHGSLFDTPRRCSTRESVTRARQRAPVTGRSNDTFLQTLFFLFSFLFFFFFFSQHGKPRRRRRLSVEIQTRKRRDTFAWRAVTRDERTPRRGSRANARKKLEHGGGSAATTMTGDDGREARGDEESAGDRSSPYSWGDDVEARRFREL